MNAELTRRLLAAGIATSLTAFPAVVRSQPPAVEKQTLTYASPDGRDLVLDLYRPAAGGARLPVIVFLHGGGWSGGTRTTAPDLSRVFAQDGFAMASIEYRLTPSISFPANVEDVKTAVRWLRANADRFNLEANHIGLWGTSAGGHLAAVAALSPPGTFEGTGHLETSSAVQCVLDAYGPSMFSSMDAQAEMEKATLQPLAAGLQNAQRGPAPAMVHDAPTSAESRLVGAPIQSVPEKVTAASPLTYVTSRAPPFLLMHGLADNAVPHHQSILLYEALVKAGNDATLRLVDGLPHTFFNRTNLDELAGPFRMDVRQHVRGKGEQTRVDRANVFDVARAFFQDHLRVTPSR